MNCIQSCPLSFGDHCVDKISRASYVFGCNWVVRKNAIANEKNLTFRSPDFVLQLIHVSHLWFIRRVCILYRHHLFIKNKKDPFRMALQLMFTIQTCQTHERPQQEAFELRKRFVISGIFLRYLLGNTTLVTITETKRFGNTYEFSKGCRPEIQFRNEEATWGEGDFFQQGRWICSSQRQKSKNDKTLCFFSSLTNRQQDLRANWPFEKAEVEPSVWRMGRHFAQSTHVATSEKI